MMIPTPTPWAPGVAPVTIPIGDYAIWSFADDAVQVWNQMGTDRSQAIQIAVIVVIVFASMLLIMRFVRSLSNEGSST